ncbi:MAG: hypothetical protein JWR50_1378 [Mucilaginibacter sp.]|nr:hypothetical protein [Mucilaginibacter sp.]
MNLLYIDTNIYLRFYDTNQIEYKKLLKSLVELKSNIFITKQIVDEINRNKLSVFKSSTDNYKKQIAITKTFLPEHLEDNINPQISSWNNQRKEIETAIKVSNDNFALIIKDIMTNISKSQDTVSKELIPITSYGEIADLDTIERAELRKQIGNPPGKVADSLGDQLSWEQLLLKVKEVTTLWIISHDYDYYTIHDKECYLNPILREDLIKINPLLDIRCFNSLSDALKDFNSSNKIDSLPSDEDLSTIAKEEESLNVRLFLSGAAIEFEPDAPPFCPLCLQSRGFSRTYLNDNITGLSTLRFVCNNCGSIYTR